MTNTEKVIKAARMALKESGVDGIANMTGITILVNFSRPGQADVEIKPQMKMRADLTERLELVASKV